MVATQMENTPITSSQYFILSETLQRSLDASKELVEFYLRQGGDSEAHLVLTLAHTSRILDRVREIYPRNKEVRPSEQGRMVELIRKQEQAIEQLLAEYDDKIW